MNTAKIITIVSFLVLNLSSPVFTQMDLLLQKLTWISQPGVYVECPASGVFSHRWWREAKRFSTNFPDLEHIFWWYGRYVWK